MNKNRLVSIFFLLWILPLCVSAGEMHHLRNQRYCEVLLLNKSFSLSVYNTIGLNNCPEDLWKKINVEAIKKETGAWLVHLNGPRYWMIDGLKNSKLINPKQKVFGGLAMREAGIVHLNLLTLLRKMQPYSPKKIERETTWVFEANKPVYELINPEGQVFVMQSYSVQKVDQTEASLVNLGSRLKLPEGWRFRTGLVKKDMDLKAENNQAVVIQDDLLNTYQLATHDFLDN